LTRERPTWPLHLVIYASAILVPIITHWAAGLKQAGVIAF